MKLQQWCRPRRLAFIVPPDVSQEVLQYIVTYNLEIWGGRFNPIVVSTETEISDSSWRFLEYCDPDVIYSLVPLSASLLDRIYRKLGPSKIHLLKSLNTASFDRYSSSSNLQNCFLSHWLLQQQRRINNNSKVIAIECLNKDEIYNFILFNFGITSNRYLGFDRTLPTENVMEFKLPSQPMGNLLNIIAKNPYEVILPIDYASTDAHLSKPEFMADERWFTVVIGDSPLNVIYYWNRILFSDTENRRTQKQLWVPSCLLKSGKLETEVVQLIRSFAWCQFEDPKLIRIVSFDTDVAVLNCIKDELNTAQIAIKSVEKITPESVPVLKRRHSYRELNVNVPDAEDQIIPSVDKSMSLPSSVVATVRPYFPIPEKIQGCWMVDNRIELHPEEYTYTNVRYWWRLPCRGNIAKGVATRVNSLGELSIQVDNESRSMKIVIPNDANILSKLVKNLRPNVNQKDMHSPSDESNKISYIQLSDKGQYFRGTIQLLGGLWQASQLFSEPYWIRSIEAIAGVKDEKIKEQELEIQRIITDHVSNNKLESTDVKAIANSIRRRFLQNAQGKESVGIEFFYERTAKMNEARLPLEKRIELGLDENNRITEEQREELKNDLQDLVKKGVFDVGIRPKCPRCGSYFWYSIQDLRKKIICVGCQYEYIWPIESPYAYKLNSLVGNAVSLHGTVPLILTLESILFHSRDSFLFLPSIELLDDSENIFAELDFVCVTDGSFVIGEVKSSLESFRKKEVGKLIRLAKEISPDKLVIAFASKELDTLRISYIDEIRRELESTYTKVEPILLNQYGPEENTYPYIG